MALSIHPTHIVDTPDNQFKLLRTGVIYGANASGKSNLVKAIKFAKDLIVDGTLPMGRIPVRPFLLDASLRTKPSVFQFSFCQNGLCWTYGFKVTSEKVIEEWLLKLSGEKETPVFERSIDDEGNVKIEFAPSITASAEDRNFFKFLVRGIRPNQLFLTESMQRNVSQFRDVWEWFARKLILVFPEWHAKELEITFRDKSKIAASLMDLLRTFDTGIANIEASELPLDASNPDFSEKERNNIEKMMMDTKDNLMLSEINDARYAIVRNEHGKLVALKLRALHPVRGTRENISFDFSEESEGTQRILDLLPTMTSLAGEDNVIIIDEIDRSLHPHVIYAFFDIFLREEIKKKSQLIATTHAENLLTFKLLRKDEIWFMDKNKDGESRMFSLEEFNPRYDKDILNSYMNGRFGAVPLITHMHNSLVKE